MVPSSQGYAAGLINDLVTCFEICWSDRSVCTIKTLVPVLIYAETDYSSLLTLLSQVCLLCFFLTFLSGHLFWPLYSSTAFAFSAALSTGIFIVTCIAIESHWPFRFNFLWQNKPQLSVLGKCSLEHISSHKHLDFCLATPRTLEGSPCTLPSSSLHPFPFVLSWGSVQENAMSPSLEFTRLTRGSCCTDFWVVHVLKDLAVRCWTCYRF